MILTAGAIAAFALTPSRTDTYESALRELEFVERTSEPSFLRYLRDDFLRKEIEQYRDELLDREPLVISVLEGLTIHVPLYCAFPNVDATIGDWTRFANDPHSSTGFYKASLKDVRAQLRQAKRVVPPKRKLLSIATVRENQRYWSAKACAGRMGPNSKAILRSKRG